MSRILKRPMFRDGGRANSKGTGIMSGIEEREGFQKGGVGLAQSPFKKFVVDPALTMASPFVNVGADLGNLTKMFFGGEPTFQYLNPFAEGSGLGVKAQPASEFYGGSKTPSIIPEAGASEMDSTTTTETTKKDDTSETTNLAKQMEKGAKRQFDDPNEIKLDDIDTFEEEVKRKADTYKRLLGAEDAAKQNFFEAVTAGGLEALTSGDTAEGVKKFSEKLEGADDLSRKATSLAIEETIKKDLIKQPDKIKEVEFLTNSGISQERALAIVYGDDNKLLPGYSYEREIADLRNQFIDDGNTHQKNFPSGYAQGEILLREGINSIKYNYNAKEMKYEASGEQIGKMKPGDILFDPVNFEYLAVDPSGNKINTISKDKALAHAKGS
jgi:mRNA-degrading endonuclease HigB of HigAB toxin-antitoxin module